MADEGLTLGIVTISRKVTSSENSKETWTDFKQISGARRRVQPARAVSGIAGIAAASGCVLTCEFGGIVRPSPAQCLYIMSHAELEHRGTSPSTPLFAFYQLVIICRPRRSSYVLAMDCTENRRPSISYNSRISSDGAISADSDPGSFVEHSGEGLRNSNVVKPTQGDGNVQLKTKTSLAI